MSPSLPDTMKCIEITEPGGPEVLKPTTRPVPTPAQGEVLIKVTAAGVNRPDVLQRQGAYPPPEGASDIPGLEVSGTIVALGDGVSDWSIGDDVCALVAGGGYAEYCTAPAPQCLPVPKGMDVEDAAAIPETFFTVWTNVFDRARLQSGETILIHGGASGIGTAAVQMASSLGATVLATAGGPDRAGACEVLGADKGIDYYDEDFVDVVKEFTGGKGVDVILDMVGGDYVQKNLTCLATEGRLVNIAYMKGPKVEVNLLPIMLKRLTVTGSTLRIQSIEAKGAIAQSLKEKVWPLLESEEIAPFIHATFDLESAAEAHALMESGELMGKAILVV